MSVRFLFPALLAPLLMPLTGCGEKAVMQAPVVSTAAVVRDGSLMTPGRPQLARLPETVPAATLQPVTWNMWWGENASQWKVYVNGALAESGTLLRQSPKAQQVTTELTLGEAGLAEIKVVLCNDFGCTESEPAVVMVGNG
ncbi:MAG: hypothetical protein IT466_11340 [Moraxellaceae bacterium]|jgi:hypothetical protein|nr:hypothetical protein [Moraxellaceae bacterium]HQV41617.1 chitinase N-terminal domain-containing protein [Moraxellaceae bacterium]HQX89068.1 chitinase N-terminal domain-containing protein [Moraxellaceae bacterium]